MIKILGVKNSEMPSILIIYTGGTIGMREDPETHTLAPMEFTHIQNEIPELSKLGIDVSATAFNPPIDSSNMRPAIWGRIARTIRQNYQKYNGFVILHGTDTMAYTASALSFMFENLDKPVILTGSQLPIGVMRTDGKENLVTAVELAAASRNGRAIVPEVCIYFNSRLFRGNRTTKEDSEKFSAFMSHNYPILARAGVDIVYSYDRINYSNNKGILKTNTNISDNVIILRMFPGMNRQYFEHSLNLPGLKGVVLESYGSGNVPTHRWLLNAIRKAIRQGVIFLNVTQCSGGRVQMGQYMTSYELLNAGVISGKDITVEAAITKLMFLLGQDLRTEEVKTHLQRSLSGEITE